MKSTPAERPPLPRVPTGMPGLDTFVSGGFPAGRSVLVAGGIGTGKTTLGVQFLTAGAEAGENGLLIAVDQKPRHIIADMRRFGWTLDVPNQAGAITVLDASPYFTAMRGARKPEPGDTAEAIVAEVRRASARRLVIDEITSLVPGGVDARRSARFFAVLISALEADLDCTALLTASAAAPAEQFTTGSLELSVRDTGHGMERVLSVRAMPGKGAQAIERPFDIVDGRGMVVG